MVGPAKEAIDIVPAPVAFQPDPRRPLIVDAGNEPFASCAGSRAARSEDLPHWRSRL
jgi:hypothetical protein